MSFTFEFQLDHAEQVRASRVVVHRRWSIWATYACCLVMFFVGVGHFIREVPLDRPGWRLAALLLAGVAAGGAIGGYSSPYWTVRSFRKGGRDPDGPNRCSLDDKGLDFKSPGATATIEWTNIIEVYESRGFLLFYISHGLALVLPKRVITAEELPRLRAALRTWVGERAHLSAA